MRRRCIAILTFISIVFVGSYFTSHWWLPSFIRLITPGKVFLHTFSYTELIQLYIKVIFFVSLCISSPFVFYQIWRFIVPGLRQHERNFVWRYSLGSLILFVCGILLSYFLVFPYIIQWSYRLAVMMHIQPVIGMRQYLVELIRWLLTFGVLFQIPIILHGLAYLQIFDITEYRHYRKYIYFISFVLASVIAPPDLMLNIILTLPIVVLFELSMVIVRWTHHRHTSHK